MTEYLMGDLEGGCEQPPLCSSQMLSLLAHLIDVRQWQSAFVPPSTGSSFSFLNSWICTMLNSMTMGLNLCNITIQTRSEATRIDIGYSLFLEPLACLYGFLIALALLYIHLPSPAAYLVNSKLQHQTQTPRKLALCICLGKTAALCPIMGL